MNKPYMFHIQQWECDAAAKKESERLKRINAGIDLLRKHHHLHDFGCNCRCVRCGLRDIDYFTNPTDHLNYCPRLTRWGSIALLNNLERKDA